MNSEKQSLSELYSVICEVEPCISRVAYNFLGEEEFKKIDSIEEMQLVYWSEIIQRLHICSATTLLRIKKWYEAMDSSYDAYNYYGFCASLRGLLEACSDSFYTIGRVLFPIAENFAHIQIAINGKASKPLFAEDLEQELIHYTHARKLSAEERERFDDSHKAKQVRQYLGSIQSESLDNLYSELCQISHPSMMSFIPFLMEQKEHGLTLHNQPLDKELNDNLLSRHRKTIYETTIFALEPALSGLKLVNLLGADLLSALQTKEEAFGSLQGYALWSDIEEKIHG